MIGRRRQKNTVKRVAIGGAIMAAAGYAAGVLTAPKSGKQTRASIKEFSAKNRVEAEKDLKQLHTQLDSALKDSKKKSGKLSKQAQKEMGEIVTRAKETKDKAREVLSAIHEGEANDKDLSKAVKDAQRALSHLKDYLKK